MRVPFSRSTALIRISRSPLALVYAILPPPIIPPIVLAAVFDTPPGGAPVLQYQTVQGAYGVLEREYCVLQQKLYGAAVSGYYGVDKNSEVMYDMPYDAVISTSLPVVQSTIQHQTVDGLDDADAVSALAVSICSLRK